MGHNSQTNTLQRRARCWGILRRRFPNWTEPISAATCASSHQQQDGESVMSDTHMDSRVRYTPYVIPSHHRRSNLYKQDQTGVNMEKEQKPPEGTLEGNKKNGTLGSWFKITIPFGIKYGEKWLLNLIQSQCSVPFTPVEFHYEKMQAQFFVENASIAYALKNVSEKIWDEDKERISIFVCPCDVPFSVQKELRSEKLAMNKQCDASQQVLDIQRLPVDPKLMTRTIEMAQGLRSHMVASLNIPKENIYKLVGMPDTLSEDFKIKNLYISKSKEKSAGEMDKGKELKPEEICADRNSLCTIIPDKTSSINSILELFPKLSCLDGQESPRPTLHGIEVHKILPTRKGSFFGSDLLKNLVLQFLQQYYFIYDYGDRQSLLGAYHMEACFSLTIPFNPNGSVQNSLCEYFQYNRDIKKLKNSYLRRQLLKHTKQDILDSLSVLPKTRHDFSSFVVDMWFQTETMICFSVNGLFKEVKGNSQVSVLRAFTRTFIATPGSNSSLYIINDKLFVHDVSTQVIKSTFYIPMATLSSSSMPALSKEQQEMVQALSIQFGMNLMWSQKCLHENHWDYTRAVQVLTLPKVKGNIPEESLTKTNP